MYPPLRDLIETVEHGMMELVEAGDVRPGDEVFYYGNIFRVKEIRMSPDHQWLAFIDVTGKLWGWMPVDTEVLV